MTVLTRKYHLTTTSNDILRQLRHFLRQLRQLRQLRYSTTCYDMLRQATTFYAKLRHSLPERQQYEGSQSRKNGGQNIDRLKNARTLKCIFSFMSRLQTARPHYLSRT